MRAKSKKKDTTRLGCAPPCKNLPPPLPDGLAAPARARSEMPLPASPAAVPAPRAATPPRTGLRYSGRQRDELVSLGFSGWQPVGNWVQQRGDFSTTPLTIGVNPKKNRKNSARKLARKNDKKQRGVQSRTIGSV